MTENNSRRKFLKTAGQSLAIAPLAFSLVDSSASATNRDHTNHLTAISNNGIMLNVKDFGAKADATTKDTLAFQQAIDRCNVLGGGEVIVPSGNYLIGAIALKSNVLLKLEPDAVLMGSPDFADYPISQVRWEGKWIEGYTALIYACNANNTGIIGNGKIMGNHALGGRPNAQNPLRHPALIEPINCSNLRFEDFSTDYYLMWSIHPTYCEQLSFRNLTIRSTGGNGDGIDIDSCKHVLIDHCDISTGDDCISLKSGRGLEGYTLLKTTEDVTITNCSFADSIFACIGIGSETSGGIRNVRIEKCNFTQAKTHAIYIKSRPGRGAFIEDIAVKDITVGTMGAGFLRFNILGSGIQDQNPVPGDEGIPTIKNFSFSNITVKDVPVLVDGMAIHPNKPLQGFSLVNVSGTCAKGISLANINNAIIKNITVTGYSGALLSVYHVKGKGLEGATTIESPKIPEVIKATDTPYVLK